MSAETLRRAAALMRERAEYAPDSPWAADVRQDGRAWIDVPNEDGHAWSMHGFPAAARHCASWHPAVALAVAHWLDDCAQFYVDFPGYTHDGEDYALAVARAYLGEGA